MVGPKSHRFLNNLGTKIMRQSGDPHYLRIGVSSKGIAVILCVCVPSFSVLAAATFSPHTRETPDILACCKKVVSS